MFLFPMHANYSLWWVHCEPVYYACKLSSSSFVVLTRTIRDDQICRFTSESKERFRGNVGVVVTTYNMVAFGGKRSEESEKIIEEIRNREWGLLLMDEVSIYFTDDFCLIFQKL